MHPTKIRPYIILPHLVEQPTWGGGYIADYKNITDPQIKKNKIGQSYELFGNSVVSSTFSTLDSQFISEMLEYNKSGYTPPQDCGYLKDLISLSPSQYLGPNPLKKHPLLIKFTQALGNSFQLHIKKSQKHQHWKPKPESWYYLEDGIITYGIKKGVGLAEYKLVCFGIENKMRGLSQKIKNKTITYEAAKKEAFDYIQKADPWQFVNTHKVKKNSIVDLSPGGIHHSWEEDPINYPLGNILYEVQVDVSDEFCTIRSFDKGKLLPDGEIRPIHIEDYFAFLDTDPSLNDLQTAMKKREGSHLVNTTFYALDIETIGSEGMAGENNTSYTHFFVVEGELHVETPNHTLSVGRGYSCFVPYGVGRFILSSESTKTTVLKTYIP